MRPPVDLATLPRRASVRVVLSAPGHDLVLLPTCDPVRPSRSPWWELPGGGIEPAETAEAAAVRELDEELGVAIGVEQVVVGHWTRTVVYPRADGWWWQDETVVRVALDQVPAWSLTGRTPEEQAAHGPPRWWSVDQVRHSVERFFPDSLPTLLPRFLRGERIAEPPVVFW